MRLLLALTLVAALAGSACGSGSSMSGSMPASPVMPSGPASSTALTGTWVGQALDSSGTMMGAGMDVYDDDAERQYDDGHVYGRRQRHVRHQRFLHADARHIRRHEHVRRALRSRPDVDAAPVVSTLDGRTGRYYRISGAGVYSTTSIPRSMFIPHTKSILPLFCGVNSISTA